MFNNRKKENQLEEGQGNVQTNIKIQFLHERKTIVTFNNQYIEDMLKNKEK